MVLISKKEFQRAVSLGYKCGEHFTRTAHGKKYAVSDYDYLAICKFFNEKFKITVYK